MIKTITLKLEQDVCIKIIESKINTLNKSRDISSIENAFNEVNSDLKSIVVSRDILKDLKSKMIYQKNEYSKDFTLKSMLNAKDRVLEFLEEILEIIKTNEVDYLNDDISQNIALIIVRRVLNNFYKHIEAMYEQPTHGKAGITNKILENIKIKNEYDVQRILYSLLKPIFPEARVEVYDDAGFLGIRYDIIIEKFSIVIEVKCSRNSMTERNLSEEIGADIYHYKYLNIFFFVYDKDKIISNTAAFIETYTKKFEEKNISTVVIQPIKL